MKANEVPEKIYLSKNLIRWSFGEPIEKSDIEYTRTDAFIEKAVGILRKELYTRFSGNEYFVSSNKAINLQELIKNFKNYMLCQ